MESNNRIKQKSIFGWISFFLKKLLDLLIGFLILDMTLLLFWGLHFKLLRWIQHQQAVFYIIIIVLSFIYFILSIWYVGQKNFYKDFDKKHMLGILFPLMLIIAIVGVGANCFAALSSILNDYGYIRLDPQLNKHSFESLCDFYFWHFFDLIPQIKLNETLQWELSLQNIDTLGNLLLLLFKFVMVWIVIEHFYIWNKWRRKVVVKAEEIEAPKT